MTKQNKTHKYCYIKMIDNKHGQVTLHTQQHLRLFQVFVGFSTGTVQGHWHSFQNVTVPVTMQFILDMSPGKWKFILKYEQGINISACGRPTSVLGSGDIFFFRL